ncbi:hypothetical protein [Telluribacter sp. SYSU D00476]|uniref:hypothetical protein n=1 Tax=Telluribacter sp. SYSU D00476 TaxID=2811430 RepID=UPI001FF69934|nr:hypothetical protein [Telluribacter sp. SYSU D00476]
MKSKETIEENDKNVEGGSPSPAGTADIQKHLDDTYKSSERLDDDAVDEFEENNMNKHKGYNEMPPDVPVTKKETRR